MKRVINRALTALALVLSSFIVACNESGDVPAYGKVSFSEILGLEMDILEEQEYTTGYFTLETLGRWSVSSDRMWVTFSFASDGEFLYDIQGGAGTDTVYVMVSNEARDFSESSATVTVMGADGEQTVGVITRLAKAYNFKMSTEEG